MSKHLEHTLHDALLQAVTAGERAMCGTLVAYLLWDLNLTEELFPELPIALAEVTKDVQ